MRKKMRGVGLLVLMLSCGVVSLAEETPPTPTDPICFDTGLINGGQEIEITGYNTSNSACGKNVVIPAEIGGKQVTSIGMDAFRAKQLTGVMIPGSVKSIGEQAFTHNQLTSVVIPGSVKSIGDYAFHDNQLTSVVISDGVTSIGDYVFHGNQLTSVVIPGSVKSIGGHAFYMNQLTGVVIPGSVKSIGDHAFYMNQLTSVVISDGVESIGETAFYNNQLTGVVIPGSVKSIGTGAFYLNKLTSVVISDGVESIGDSAFYANQLTGVVIPGSVKSIGKDAFADNLLTSVVIPGSVTSIGEQAFAVNQLTGVVIPGSVTSIGAGAFYLNKLTSVVIPGSVKSIGDYAFADNLLTSVVIPDSVTSIGAGAFYKESVTDGYTGVVVGIVTKYPTTVGENAYIKLVKFDLAGGTGTVNITCEGTGCSVTAPTRAGYIFSGWSEELKVWDEDLSAWNTGHQTIKARWNSDPSSSSSSSSSSWGGYSWGGGISHSSTSSSSSSTSTPSTEQKKPETPVKNEPVKTEQVKTEIFNPTIQTTCFNPLDKQTIDQGNKISELLRIAHQMLYSYSLTKWQGTKDFAPERSLTREEAARFMTEFATNVLCRKASRTYNDHFTDLEKVNPELLPYIKKSYEYLIFNGDSNAEGKKEKTTFRPKELITVGELSAIMTRLVRNELLEEVQGDRSKNYRTYINAITPKSDLKNEVRGTVAEVIYDLYRNNSYELKDIGYVIKK